MCLASRRLIKWSDGSNPFGFDSIDCSASSGPPINSSPVVPSRRSPDQSKYMQKRSGKKAMGFSTDATAKKARTPTRHQPEVLVLQRAHWRPPQRPAGELHGGDGPIRRSCGYSELQIYAHVQDAHAGRSYSHLYIFENILFTFFSIHHL